MTTFFIPEAALDAQKKRHIQKQMYGFLQMQDLEKPTF